MTFSLLVRDPQTGAIGGVAATGSLCVGGWVLRGRWGAGLSASQGAAPSTFWGEDVLSAMERGETAGDAVTRITEADPGRGHRQLSALDMSGEGAAFDGTDNTPAIASTLFPGGVAAGNMLANRDVIDAMIKVYRGGAGPFANRLITALRGAEAAGSDSRGLLSAALLVLHPDRAPLTLRIDDHASDPIGALADLHRRATTGPYADWAGQVPSVADPYRVLD